MASPWVRWLLLGVVSGHTAATGLELREQLQAAIQEVARHESSKYNCSVSIALRTADHTVTAASGTVDFSTNRQASVSDLYPFGSITKMLTASSIMKLVSRGQISLDDPIGPLVDPFLKKMSKANPKQNFSSVSDLWGEAAPKSTLRQLLGMKSGIPDFDTAKPSMHGKSLDPLRALLYGEPNRSNSPTDLMSVPWVKDHFKPCKPMGPIGMFCYSSTNFMLLGMVLAAKAGEDTWRSLNQSTFLPPSLVDKIRFANHGAPRDWGTVHGYDRTAYNMPAGEHNDHDNWEVDGVLTGWTASNLITTAENVVELTWQIWGPPHGVAPKEYIDQMVPKGHEFYGLGAFNLSFLTGHTGSMGTAYGHLGATYGYQSVTVYFPELNIALSVATNIETDNQVQPSDSICKSYNAIAGIMLKKSFDCEFKSMGYYYSTCRCTSSTALIV